MEEIDSSSTVVSSIKDEETSETFTLTLLDFTSQSQRVEGRAFYLIFDKENRINNRNLDDSLQEGRLVQACPFSEVGNIFLAKLSRVNLEIVCIRRPRREQIHLQVELLFPVEMVSMESVVQSCIAPFRRSPALRKHLSCLRLTDNEHMYSYMLHVHASVVGVAGCVVCGTRQG